jgi:acyl dehydratase
MERIENRTFDEIKLGDTASLVRTLTHKDIELFAIMSGDVNPTHLDDAFANSRFMTPDLFADGAVMRACWRRIAPVGAVRFGNSTAPSVGLPRRRCGEVEPPNGDETRTWGPPFVYG